MSADDESRFPDALAARDVPPNTVRSNYPEPFASRVAARTKRKLGDRFGLTNFGVNLTCIEPGGVSSMRHSHALQDEFIYVLEGCPVLHANDGPVTLAPGMCAGFKAGTGRAHSLSNPTEEPVWYLEIGDRTPGDEVVYPDDDLDARQENGVWVFRRKDGRLY